MNRRVGAATTLALVGTLLVTGCSGSEPAKADSSTPAPSRDLYSVEAALRDLPPVEADDGAPLQVFSSDLAAAATLGDLPDPVDQKSTTAWYQGLHEPPLYVPAGKELGFERMQSGAMRKILGFDARDVLTHASVESGPRQITVVGLEDGVSLKKGVTATGAGKIGDIDPAEIADAPFPFITGVTEQGNDIALGTASQLLTDWKKRGDRSLADNAAFLDVAKALDSHGVYGAMLSDRSVPPRLMDPETIGSTIPDFDAVGIGEGLEDGAAVEYIAYRLDDADEARDTIEAVWRDGFSIRTGPLEQVLQVDDVTAQGNVVTVRITPLESPGIAMEMLQLDDPPFIVLDQP